MLSFEICVIIIEHACGILLWLDQVSTTSLCNNLQVQLSNRMQFWNLVELRWSFFAEIVDVFKSLAIFTEELYRGCLTGF